MNNQTPSPPASGKDPENRVPVEATPRWVKVFGIAAGIVILLVVVMHLLGGGFHDHTIR